jgi:hypothetical protein
MSGFKFRLETRDGTPAAENPRSRTPARLARREQLPRGS